MMMRAVAATAALIAVALCAAAYRQAVAGLLIGNLAGLCG
jgi:hypothetical protein